MKPKAVLLAAILVSIPVPPAAAEEPGTGKQASDRKEVPNPPVKEHKLDFKELFGCEPMGEDGHPMSHAAAGGPETGNQEVPQAAGVRDPVK